MSRTTKTKQSKTYQSFFCQKANYDCDEKKANYDCDEKKSISGEVNPFGRRVIMRLFNLFPWLNWQKYALTFHYIALYWMIVNLFENEVNQNNVS